MAEQEDTGLAWSCAADLRLDEDAGPRCTDRRDALVGRYARQILLELDADYPRILALRAECRQQAADARRLPEAWRLVQARRRPPLRRPWPQALRALSRSERRDRSATWALGAELAQRAVQIITEAGAQLDEEARAELLAADAATATAPGSRRRCYRSTDPTTYPVVGGLRAARPDDPDERSDEIAARGDEVEGSPRGGGPRATGGRSGSPSPCRERSPEEPTS